MKIWIVAMKFLLIGALFIVSNQNLYLNNVDDRRNFYDLYYDWMNNLFGHAKQITGYVVNSEWLPKNNDTSASR